jgi:hypothetical protein
MDARSAEIEAFFRDFERHSNSGDVEQAAALFADPFMTADPTGSRSVSAADMRAAVPKRKQLFDAMGCRGTTLVSIDQTPLDDDYVMARTNWAIEFPSQVLTLSSTYIVSTSGGRFKIVFYLNHQNLTAVLKDRGLMPAAPA